MFRFILTEASVALGAACSLFCGDVTLRSLMGSSPCLVASPAPPGRQLRLDGNFAIVPVAVHRAVRNFAMTRARLVPYLSVALRALCTHGDLVRDRKVVKV